MRGRGRDREWDIGSARRTTDGLDGGVLAFVTGDRPKLEVEVGPDVLPRLPRHLDAIGKQHRLALVLYTLGGDTNTPWPFVNFLRAYCDELVVLVPFWRTAPAR